MQEAEGMSERMEVELLEHLSRIGLIEVDDGRIIVKTTVFRLQEWKKFMEEELGLEIVNVVAVALYNARMRVEIWFRKANESPSTGEGGQ